ncbi:MAG: hypothetical protein COA86_00255 [Kangiella sp.]|nr:MAG: hypothetical protein COA86_00255 [Kangiella sp.]
MTDDQQKANIDKYRPKINFSALFKFIVNHPGLVVFIVYAVIAIAGFIHVITFYRHFDLDVIIYLEIGDILVAGIKDPMVMLMVMGSFTTIFILWVIAYLQAPFSAWLHKKFNKGFFKFLPYLAGVVSNRSFWWTSIIVTIPYFYLFISIHSEKKSISIKEGRTNVVLVQSDAISDRNQQFSILGTSINYIFLYNLNQQDTLIIPLENVTAIKPIIIKGKTSKTTKEIQLNTKEN